MRASNASTTVDRRQPARRDLGGEAVDRQKARIGVAGGHLTSLWASTSDRGGDRRRASRSCRMKGRMRLLHGLPSRALAQGSLSETVAFSNS